MDSDKDAGNRTEQCEQRKLTREFFIQLFSTPNACQNNDSHLCTHASVAQKRIST